MLIENVASYQLRFRKAVDCNARIGAQLESAILRSSNNVEHQRAIRRVGINQR